MPTPRRTRSRTSSARPDVETPREESDQLPEEAPADQVPDDAGGDARDEADEGAGARGDQDSDAGDATGNPANAG